MKITQKRWQMNTQAAQASDHDRLERAHDNQPEVTFGILRHCSPLQGYSKRENP